MECQSRDVNLKGVGVKGSVNGSLREKPGVDRCCIRPGVVHVASEWGIIGCSWLLDALLGNSPSSFIFCRQDQNFAAKSKF